MDGWGMDRWTDLVKQVQTIVESRILVVRQVCSFHCAVCLKCFLRRGWGNESCIKSRLGMS